MPVRHAAGGMRPCPCRCSTAVRMRRRVFLALREAHAREHSLTSRVRLTLSHHGHSQTGPPSSPIARPVDVAITPKKENQIRLESGLSYLLMGVADR